MSHFTQLQLQSVTSYLRLTVIRKHGARRGRMHFNLCSDREGIRLMVAMGIAEPAENGEAWEKPTAIPVHPDGFARLDVASIIIDLASTRHRLNFVDGTPKAPTINAAHDLGPAMADPETLEVLRALGVVTDECWSDWALEAVKKATPFDWLLLGGHALLCPKRTRNDRG